ncbi:hypothetical protein PpBr36_00179 [Pyricularia pennisetigena]|uniref:hypothetical protein n=1 Tax=Pyricularia pennisetigena TaxID=1578925 RepID=UPI00114E008A|nr:hypothetical protein PpBr36_00179 [Pyricularia pennisetigena]TLS28265.1 hypothetical protein PpBr36_00179 [Pyricularia pennisetigena]
MTDASNDACRRGAVRSTASLSWFHCSEGSPRKIRQGAGLSLQKVTLRSRVTSVRTDWLRKLVVQDLFAQGEGEGRSGSPASNPISEATTSVSWARYSVIYVESLMVHKYDSPSRGRNKNYTY